MSQICKTSLASNLTRAFCALIVLILSWSAATDCFEAATWPKLIGYGKADTEIVDIDRRVSDGMLALLIKSDETDLLNNAGTSADTRILTVYDPDAEVYKWLKVFSYGWYGNYHARFVFFTPDGSKVLASLMIAERRSLVYFDANDGVLKGNGISAYNCCPYLKTKDALTMNSDGSLIIFITNRA